MRTGSIHQLFSEINGVPTYVETVTSNGSAATSSGKANAAGTGSAKGLRLLVQPDAACYIKVGATTETGVDGAAVPTVTAANGLKLAADEKFFLCLTEDNFPTQGLVGMTKIQVISASGTANLKIFRLD